MNTQTKWIIGSIILVILIWLGTSFPGGKDVVQDEAIRIGVIESLTGNASYYGELNRQGVEVAKDLLLQEYPNLQLEVFHEDSFYTAKGGADAYSKLKNINNIDAVVTHGSPVSLAVKPLAATDGILQMAVSSSVSGYSSPNDLSFRVSTVMDVEIAPMSDFIVEQDYKNIGLLFMQNDFGVSANESMKNALKDRRVEERITIEEGFIIDNTDFRTTLLKLKEANVDAVYVVGLASNIANIIKQANELDFNPQFLGTRSSEDPVLLNNAGNLANGFIYTYAFDPNGDYKEANEFAQAFRIKYGKDPDGYAAEGYEGLRLTVNAFIECGKDYSCIQSYLENLKDYPSIFGELTFNENGDVTYGFFLKTIRDNQFTRLAE